MNYLYSAQNACCYSFNGGDYDSLKISKNKCLIDKKTGKLEFWAELRIGAEYSCEEKWTLFRGYNEIKTYDTKEEAEQEMQKILKELASGDKIISI